MKNPTILIIEDDPWMAACYQHWLAASYTVVHAADALAALDAIDDHAPGLIMLDLLLPVANGIQLLNELRSHIDLVSIPIMLCSSAIPPDMPDVSAYGVKAICNKAQLTPQRLRATISEVLAHAAAAH